MNKCERVLIGLSIYFNYLFINIEIFGNHRNKYKDRFVKKSRQGRKNEKQSSFLVDYMVQLYPHVAAGKFNCFNGRENMKDS